MDPNVGQQYQPCIESSLTPRCMRHVTLSILTACVCTRKGVPSEAAISHDEQPRQSRTPTRVPPTSTTNGVARPQSARETSQRAQRAPPVPTVRLNNGVDMPMMLWGSGGSTQENATSTAPAVRDALIAGFPGIDCANHYHNQVCVCVCVCVCVRVLRASASAYCVSAPVHDGNLTYVFAASFCPYDILLQVGVARGIAMARPSLPHDPWLQTKVEPCGHSIITPVRPGHCYNDTLAAFEQNLVQLNVSSVDLTLIHSPPCIPNSTWADPQCMWPDQPDAV